MSKTELEKFIEYLKDDFNSKINTKNTWGKKQIKYELLLSLNFSLLRLKGEQWKGIKNK